MLPVRFEERITGVPSGSDRRQQKPGTTAICPVRPLDDLMLRQYGTKRTNLSAKAADAFRARGGDSLLRRLKQIERYRLTENRGWVASRRRTVAAEMSRPAGRGWCISEENGKNRAMTPTRFRTLRAPGKGNR